MTEGNKTKLDQDLGLFVYGTLAPGRTNHHHMSIIEGHWEAAWLRGSLHQEGWGATLGYPAITPDETASEVAGFLFRGALEAHWQRLDDFEGEAYERRIVTVRLEDESSVDAYVYALKE
ncbi:MAG: gamma-glutamylcyclotransferase family protein [Pseudomonadota bacterium]